jgi:tRNA(fMet)-specific endonuclease VapC
VRYLLDTNIISDLVRNPQGQIAERIASIGEESVCTSIIVAAELRSERPRKAPRV